MLPPGAISTEADDLPDPQAEVRYRTEGFRVNRNRLQQAIDPVSDGADLADRRLSGDRIRNALGVEGIWLLDPYRLI